MIPLQLYLRRLGNVTILLLLVTSCSLTRNLPSGEVLYTGAQIKVTDKKIDRVGETALEEVNAALNKTPDTKMWGGLIPLPYKVWLYNGLSGTENVIGRWILQRFGANPPLFIDALNPEVRTKIATNLLKDYGFFQGKVTAEVVPHKRDSLQASVRYLVSFGQGYRIDTVYYRGFSDRMLRMLDRARPSSYLKPGKSFNVTELDEERTRISTLLRNRGYYYFRPDYLTYQADTTLHSGRVSLRLQPVPGLPSAARKPYFMGRKSAYLLGRNGEQPTDSLTYRDLNIYYHRTMPVRPTMLYRWMNYQDYLRNARLRDTLSTRLYNQRRHERVQERINKLGIFGFTDFVYTLRDTLPSTDTLDVRFIASMAKPWDVEAELNAVLKSNEQMGPGGVLGLTRYNVFRGGESWNIRLKGSYEWQTGAERTNTLMNSWEVGLSSSLTFPKVLFPRMGKQEFDFQASTTFRLSINQLNRARYYKLLSFGGNVTYDAQPTNVSRYSLTPFRLYFNVLQHRTEEFVELSAENPALYVSLQNQFVPAMEYSYTFDNLSRRGVQNPTWLQATFISAGNITSLIYRAAGHPFSQEGKTLMGVPFAQFVKFNAEHRYLWNMDRNNRVATRVAAGAIFTYGNSKVAPYNEQFYVGGANSLRAFTIRSIGPGSYHPEDSRYSYLDQTGTFRLEANLEFRFRIFKDLWGAGFIDAGNVWLLREDSNRPGARLRWSNILDQIALGTGAGLRYDMGMLVFRFDVGLPLHLPYSTARKGYYNVDGTWWKHRALHFAIGYPF